MSGRSRTLRLAVLLLAGVGGLFLLVVYTPLANLLVMPLYPAPSTPPRADVIIILSGGRYLDGSLNEAALERTVTAVRLYRQGLAPRLLFTGGPCCGSSASALMADLAAGLCVPPSAILLEEQSERTHESAAYSVALLRTHGLKSAILVTSPIHLRRATLAFEAAGLLPHPVPASNRDLRLVSGAAERISLLQDVIHEYLGLASYRVRGWI